MKDEFEKFRKWGAEGAKITNAMRTKEDRVRAAKKGWEHRRLVVSQRKNESK